MGITASSLLIQGLSGHRGHESESIRVFGARHLEILETGSTPSECCVDEHFPFDKVPEALSKSLTARSGGKLIIDEA